MVLSGANEKEKVEVGHTQIKELVKNKKRKKNKRIKRSQDKL